MAILVHANGYVAYPRPTTSDDPGEAAFLGGLATSDGEIAVGSVRGVLRISYPSTKAPGRRAGWATSERAAC